MYGLMVGDKVKYHYDECDGRGCIIAEVTQVFDDHAIAETHGMSLWIDKDTAFQFQKIADEESRGEN